MCALCVVASAVCELMLPMLMSTIINIGVAQADFQLVLWNSGIMVAWAFASMAFNIVAQAFSARISSGFGRNIRNAIYLHVTNFSTYEMNKLGTSTLITRTTNDVQQLERFVQMALSIVIKAPTMFVGSVAMSLIASPTLSMVSLCAIPVILLAAIIIMRICMPLMRSLQKKIDKLNLVTREGLSGILVIRSYRKEEHEQKRFEKANKDLAQTNVSVSRRISLLMPAITLILNLVIVVILWIGANLINNSAIEVGTLMAVIEYSTHVLISVVFMSGIILIAPRALAAAERINQALNTKITIVDTEFDKQQTIQPASAHEVRFENVSFTYPESSKQALSNINLTFEAGKTYVVIGATGSGRSTIANLIEKFIEPSSGRILIDGIDISKVTQKNLRTLIAYAPQKTVLFSGSIADNISYGRTDATKEEIEQAAKDALAYDFISKKPDGFNTFVTQAGTNLSGGQKQRVSIARAMMKKSGLYIFDDSFCALDFQTEMDVRSNLRLHSKDATMIMIAQRVNTAMDADCVLVLNEGKVVGFAPHDELIKTCETYKEIAASQLEDEDLQKETAKRRIKDKQDKTKEV